MRESPAEQPAERAVEKKGPVPFVAVVLFALLTVVVSLQVFTRFVLHVPFIWSEEVARFLFFWVVLLGAAMSVKKRRHFVIDIAMGRRAAGRTRQLLFDIIPHICVITFAVLLLVQGIDYVRVGVLRTATNSRINMGLVYAAIPVFAALTILYSTRNLSRDVQSFLKRRSPESSPPPVAE